MSSLPASDSEKIDSLISRTPSDFLLGVATSSWQIEGSSTTRGRCIWDDFSEVPGNILDGALSDPACDHINRWESDLDLLSWFGVDSYRFSVSWPRVLPTGEGAIDAKGLGFYDKLIDGLLERNIKPSLTIYHWDLPSALQSKGGWNWDGIDDVFAQYTEVLARKFADRVPSWSTFNEPWCIAFLGYADKVMAPGKSDAAAGLEAAYRILTSHARSLEVLRQHKVKEAGIVLNLTTYIPEDDGAIPAARHMDGIMNRIWLDPLAGRGFPEDIVKATQSFTDWSFVDETKLTKVSAPLDWLGINYYTPTRLASVPDKNGRGPANGARPDAFPGIPPIYFVPRLPVTTMGWEIHPESLTTTLKTTQERLPGVPMYITENGGAFPDEMINGAISDHDRIDYYEGHLSAILDAKESGVDVRGYYAWSFLDNLEWAEGWSKRFGLVHVDPETQLRTPKLSAYFYRELLARLKRKRTSPTISA
ncbi:MAG: GH1 family beta-glucosidase [Actinomycetota bacterium]